MIVTIKGRRQPNHAGPTLMWVLCSGCGVLYERKPYLVARARREGRSLYCKTRCMWDHRPSKADSAEETRRKAREHATKKRRARGAVPREEWVRGPLSVDCDHCGKTFERDRWSVENAERSYCGKACQYAGSTLPLGEAKERELKRLATYREAHREAHREWTKGWYQRTGRRKYAVRRAGEEYADAYLALMDLDNEIHKIKRGEDNG